MMRAPSFFAGRNEIGCEDFTRKPATMMITMREIFKMVEPF